jgi:cysteine desulfurase
MQLIYLDASATTPLLPEVRQAMLPFLDGTYGNPASAHGAGRQARRALEDARERTAALLGATAEEVVFTSGATEANNLAIFGLVDQTVAPHVLVSPIEHPSVAEPIRQLAAQGVGVETLVVDCHGVVSPASLAGRLRPETALVCVMLVNHETGAVQPITDLVGGARQSPGTKLSFHCDATQAAGKLPIDFHALGVTTLSLSAHKFHGPVGVGVLLIRHGTRLRARTWGGHQQQGRRPGTEPVALAVGLAAALDLACREREQRYQRVTRLRQLFLEYLQAAAPIVVNGSPDGSPYIVNISFPGCSADSLLMNLDLAGVACSTGSACSSGSLLPSPVLQAMGVPEDVLRSAMRFSFHALLTDGEVEEAARRIVAAVQRLRTVS